MFITASSICHHGLIHGEETTHLRCNPLRERIDVTRPCGWRSDVVARMRRKGRSFKPLIASPRSQSMAKSPTVFLAALRRGAAWRAVIAVADDRNRDPRALRRVRATRCVPPVKKAYLLSFELGRCVFHGAPKADPPLPLAHVAVMGARRRQP